MLLLAANYILNGRIYSDISLVDGGPPSYFFDFYTAVSIAVVLAIFRYIPSKPSLRKSLAAWASASALAILAPIAFIPVLFDGVDTDSASYRTFVQLGVQGFVQAIILQLLVTLLLASLSESRAALKAVAVQRARLLHLKSTLELQVAEVNQRLEVDVKAKLKALIENLAANLTGAADPKHLAQLVRETLDEGVRPLSWQISTEGETEPDFSRARLPRTRARDWFAFKLQLRESTTVLLTGAIMVTFDVPLVQYVFGSEAAIACLASIVVVTSGMTLILKLIGRLRVNNLLALVAMTTLYSALGLNFVAIRFGLGDLSVDLGELGVVFSFAQIAFLTSLFRIALARRRADLDAATLVNADLEILVSALRQSAWLQKQRLARIVHGPVQSTLFATYLELSQVHDLDPARRNELARQVQSAILELASPGEGGSMPFALVVRQLTDGWGDSIRFQTEIESVTSTKIDESPVTRSCAIEVLREAVNNAAKYGTGDVEISIAMHGETLVAITVRNTVSSSYKENASGFGSKVLDEVTHSWSLTVRHGVAVFSALVATVD